MLKVSATLFQYFQSFYHAVYGCFLNSITVTETVRQDNSGRNIRPDSMKPVFHDFTGHNSIHIVITHDDIDICFIRNFLEFICHRLMYAVISFFPLFYCLSTVSDCLRIQVVCNFSIHKLSFQRENYANSKSASSFSFSSFPACFSLTHSVTYELTRSLIKLL